jgi:SNF2 family DNA or RNA helicase
VENDRRVQRMKRLLAPFVLRRLKSEVATNLEGKTQLVEKVTMLPDQAAAYAEATAAARKTIQKKAGAKRLGKTRALFLGIAGQNDLSSPLSSFLSVCLCLRECAVGGGLLVGILVD